MTSDQIILALIAATPGTVGAILAWRKGKQNATQGIQNATAIERVHISINSRMDELLKAARGEASAEGREVGRAERNEST